MVALVVALAVARLYQLSVVEPVVEKLQAEKRQVVGVVVALEVRVVARLVVVVAHVVARLAAPPVRLPVFVPVPAIRRLLRVVVELKLFRRVPQKQKLHKPVYAGLRVPFFYFRLLAPFDVLRQRLVH